jgi:hypothetical protein
MRHRQSDERSHRWRVFVALTAGLVGMVGLDPAAASDEAPAVAAGSTELTVSGAFSATGTFEPTADCPSFHTVHTGQGNWIGLGDVTFALDYCVALSSEATSPLGGTIAITAAEGTLTGTVEGTLSGTGGAAGYPADYTATITAGAGAYETVTGTLELTGMWDDPEIPVYSMHGTVSGVLELSEPQLAHPTSILDCLHGGWRDVVDDDGQDFAGLGGCILYVIIHR